MGRFGPLKNRIKAAPWFGNPLVSEENTPKRGEARPSYGKSDLYIVKC